MTVAVSILLAALVGGVVFVLLDSWQRRSEAAPAPEPQPVWVPETRTEPLWTPPPSPRWDDRDDEQDPPQPPGLWSGWSR